jgi:phage-related holin
MVTSYSGWKSKRIFSSKDKKIWLFTMIASHITLILGLYQWILGRFGLLTYVKSEGVSMMKNATLRFYQMEHPVMMIVSILLITLGYGMAKKSVEDEKKYKKAFQYFMIALVLILMAIPWPFREVGRPLFPGM